MALFASREKPGSRSGAATWASIVGGGSSPQISHCQHPARHPGQRPPCSVPQDQRQLPGLAGKGWREHQMGTEPIADPVTPNPGGLSVLWRSPVFVVVLIANLLIPVSRMSPAPGEVGCEDRVLFPALRDFCHIFLRTRLLLALSRLKL